MARAVGWGGEGEVGGSKMGVNRPVSNNRGTWQDVTRWKGRQGEGREGKEERR